MDTPLSREYTQVVGIDPAIYRLFGLRYFLVSLHALSVKRLAHFGRALAQYDWNDEPPANCLGVEEFRANCSDFSA